MSNTILNAGGKTIVLFSRNSNIVQLNGLQVQKLSRIFDLLQERAEDQEHEDKEMLYGTLVDCFEMESYFTDESQDHDVSPRNLDIIQIEGDFDNSTAIAFGYLNSKDCYIEPSELEFLKEDLTWFVTESGRCTEETKEFIDSLIGDISDELELIKNEAPFNRYYYKD